MPGRRRWRILNKKNLMSLPCARPLAAADPSGKPSNPAPGRRWWRTQRTSAPGPRCSARRRTCGASWTDPTCRSPRCTSSCGTATAACARTSSCRASTCAPPLGPAPQRRQAPAGPAAGQQGKAVAPLRAVAVGSAAQTLNLGVLRPCALGRLRGACRAPPGSAACRLDSTGACIEVAAEVRRGGANCSPGARAARHAALTAVWPDPTLTGGAERGGAGAGRGARALHDPGRARAVRVPGGRRGPGGVQLAPQQGADHQGARACCSARLPQRARRRADGSPSVPSSN